MYLIITISVCVILIGIAFFISKNNIKRIEKENEILAQKITKISEETSIKIQVFVRLSQILASSLSRNLLFQQISNELSDFFQDTEFSIVLRTEDSKIKVISGTDGTTVIKDNVDLAEVIKAATVQGKHEKGIWEPILDSKNLLSYIYSFPLFSEEQIKGYFIVSLNHSLTKNDQLFFTDIAGLLSSVLQNILTVEEKNYINEQFGRSVDPKVRDYLLSTKQDGRVLSLSVLFFDIRSFTTLAEKLGPVKTVSLLNEIFSKCDDIIKSEGGLINKFTGDGFMAIFGAPFALENHEMHAVKASQEILRTIEIPCGIGIASGEAVAGTIGSQNRKEYTVIGDTVNTASRIEGLCKMFGSSLIVSYNTKEGASSTLTKSRCLGTLKLKGKVSPIKVYDLHTKEGDYSTNFSTALNLYYNKEISEALDLFNQCAKAYPNDKAITWYQNRCAWRIENPDEWNGIEELTEK